MTHPLEERLGYRFAERSLLEQALTHSTYANEHPEDGQHNERLEFLGDAVVGLLTADMLFDRLDDAPEGQLTKRRARVVRREGLAEIARSIDLGAHLRLGEGQRRAGGHYSDRILADSMEALAAAVYRDGGMKAVQQALGPFFLEALRHSDDPMDFKTALQEQAHAHGSASPSYRVVNVSGPDHARVYEVEVVIDEESWGAGSGSSKKAAEQAAAEQALERYRP